MTFSYAVGIEVETQVNIQSISIANFNPRDTTQKILLSSRFVEFISGTIRLGYTFIMANRYGDLLPFRFYKSRIQVTNATFLLLINLLNITFGDI